MNSFSAAPLWLDTATPVVGGPADSGVAQSVTCQRLPPTRKAAETSSDNFRSIWTQLTLERAVSDFKKSGSDFFYVIAVGCFIVSILIL